MSGQSAKRIRLGEAVSKVSLKYKSIIVSRILVVLPTNHCPFFMTF